MSNRGITKQRAALLRAVSQHGALGIETPALSAALGIRWAYSIAARAEADGHLTSDAGAFRRWFITDVGRLEIETPAGPDLKAARIRIRDLENEVMRLREMLNRGCEEPPVEWGLTPRESRLVVALASVFPRVMSHDRVMETVWPDSYPAPQIISVTVATARKKLAPHAVTIQNTWGRGYSLCERGAAAISR